MTKPTLKIRSQEWMGDMLVQTMEPMAEFLLLKLMMMAEQAAGWLCAGTRAMTVEDFARVSRLSAADIERFLPQLIDMGFVARDTARNCYYLPERVAQAELSRVRSEVSKKGGGNPALRRRNGAQEDLFKQNPSNVISFDESAASRKTGRIRGQKKKKNQKEKNNNNIYTPDNPLYFDLGCIRLNKRDYLAWKERFPFLDLDTELANRAAWLETQPTAAQEKWFVSTGFALKNRNAAAEIRYNAREGGVA